MSDKTIPPDPSDQQRPRWPIVLIIAILLGGLVIYTGTIIRKKEPDFYAPGRAALVNARRNFEESLVYEKALLEQKRMAHKEMALAIDQLAEAKDFDPADRDKIEDIRARLQAIDTADCPQTTSPKQLQQQFRDLLNEIDSLISEMQNSVQKKQEPL